MSLFSTPKVSNRSCYNVVITLKGLKKKNEFSFVVVMFPETSMRTEVCQFLTPFMKELKLVFLESSSSICYINYIMSICTLRITFYFLDFDIMIPA